jgi:CPA2 family monovalent cation:H+ antiporter-2
VSKRGEALAGARWSLKLRYRAFRLARHHRRRARLENKPQSDITER